MGDTYDDYEDDESTPPRRVISRAAAPAEAPADEAPASTAIRSGWGAAQKVMEQTSTYSQAFLPDENPKIVRFLEDSPYANFSRHWVKRIGQNGQQVNRPYTCLESVDQTCPLCDLLGDRPAAVFSFNVALIDDDGTVSLKSWDVGKRLLTTLKGLNNNPKTGPLTRLYYAVQKTGKGTTTAYNVAPVSASSLEETYGLQPPSPDEIGRLKRYDAGIIQIPKASELTEIAQELAGSDEYA